MVKTVKRYWRQRRKVREKSISMRFLVVKGGRKKRGGYTGQFPVLDLVL